MTTSINRTLYVMDAKHSGYDKAMMKSAKETKNFSNANRNLVSSIALIDGPLGGVASRASNFNSIMNSGGLALGAFTIGISALTFGVVRLARVMGELQVEMGKTDALLKVTGGSSGLLSTELDDMARNVARSTLASTTEIRQAINSLLSFKSVGSSIFGDVISLSQDMAAIWGGSAATNARKLGKALEDPVKQLSRLETTVGAFESDTRQAILAMAEMGNVAGAQAMILQELENRIGGASEGANSGIYGALDRLGQAWDEFFEGIDSAILLSTKLENTFNGFASLLEDIAYNYDTAFGTSARAQFRRASRELVSLQEELFGKEQALKKDANAITTPLYTSQIADLREQIELRKLELRTLQDVMDREVEIARAREEQLRAEQELADRAARAQEEEEEALKKLEKLRVSSMSKIEKELHLNRENLKTIKELSQVAGVDAEYYKSYEDNRHIRAKDNIYGPELDRAMRGLGDPDTTNEQSILDANEERERLIKESRDRGEISFMKYNQLMEKEAKRHSQAMIDFANYEAGEKEKAQQEFWQNATSLMSSKSRTMFEIGKVAAISNAVISATESIPHAYKWGTKIGGPALGAAFAATAAAATAVQIQQIKATEFGADNTPSANSGGSSQPDFIPFEDTREPTQIIFNGDISGFDAGDIEKFAQAMKDYIDNTDFVLVETTSRNGQELTA